MAIRLNRNGPPLPSWAPLAACLALSLACVAVYSREGESGPLHAVQGGFQTAVTPLTFIGAAVGAVTDAASTAVGDVTADEATLSTLVEQNEELRELVAQAEEYRQEAQRLQGLLGLVDEYEIDGIAARVIGRSAEAWNQSITLGAGEDSGVDAGMTVVGSSGVIGQVVSTTAGTATVRLLTDPQSGVAVIVQSNRAEGIVRGSLEGLLYLEDVDSESEVVVGDVVVTSGLGGSYVSGIIVGTVVSVEGDEGTDTRTIIVSPNDEVTPLEEVVVVQSLGAGSSDAADEEGDAQ